MSREQILCILLMFCVVNTVSIQSQLSLGRANLAATATSKGRELAFFGGGNYGSNTYSNVDVFDSLGNLINTTYLSVARFYLAATSVGELAMFGGGFDSSSVIYDTIDVYNATSMNANIMKLSVPRYMLSAASSADLAFFAGGISGSVTVSIVDIYNVTSQKWIHTNLSEARCNIAATSVGELVFFAGGSSDNYHDVVDIYNVTLGDWLPVEHLSESRWGASAASVGRLAIFAGGYSASGFSDVIDIYDSITGVWSVAKLSAKRGYMAATTIGDLVFFGGGAYGHYLYTAVIDIYDYSNNEWNSTLMSQPRGSYAATTVGQLALLGGGFTQLGNNVGVTTVVDIYAYCNNVTFTYEVNVCDPVIPLNPPPNHSQQSHIKIYIIVGSAVGAFLLIKVSVAIFIRRVYKKRKLQYIEIPTVPPIPMIKDITVMERLGGGQFGEVYRGVVQKTSIVALKKLISGDRLSEFEREASVLCTLNHPNIVRFYGIHIGPNKENFIVTEYLSDGSLDHLLQQKSDEISVYDLVYMCQHVIAGMSYLKENCIVHRDLALRNLLVTRDENGKYVVKVADFGMSRLINKGYYKTDDKTIPIKWSAPEFIEFGTCTYKSDVWSFGVCLWEMFSYGRLPYPGMTNRQVIDNVLGGYRMEIPNGCPVEVYSVMIACWNKDPQNRPNFEELAQSIEECSVLYHRNESQVADLESLNYVVDDVAESHYN